MPPSRSNSRGPTISRNSSKGSVRDSGNTSSSRPLNRQFDGDHSFIDYYYGSSGNSPSKKLINSKNRQKPVGSEEHQSLVLNEVSKNLLEGNHYGDHSEINRSEINRSTSNRSIANGINSEGRPGRHVQVGNNVAEVQGCGSHEGIRGSDSLLTASREASRAASREASREPQHNMPPYGAGGYGSNLNTSSAWNSSTNMKSPSKKGFSSRRSAANKPTQATEAMTANYIARFLEEGPDNNYDTNSPPRFSKRDVRNSRVISEKNMTHEETHAFMKEQFKRLRHAIADQEKRKLENRLRESGDRSAALAIGTNGEILVDKNLNVGKLQSERDTLRGIENEVF
jgi:hypothetical protein